MYESILSEILMKYLCNLYGLQNNILTYRIFLLRYYIEKCLPCKKLNSINLFELKSNLPKFLIEELNLPLVDNNIIYKNEKISLYLSTTSSSIRNIIEDWHFRYFDKIKIQSNKILGYEYKDIESEIKTIIISTKKNLKRNKIVKKNNDYTYFFRQTALDIISEIYQLKVQAISHPINDFLYPLSFDNNKLILEEKYKILTKNCNFKLKECMLEKFLIKNLNYVEMGLTFIKNQVDIGQGRLDILAKDKNNKYCIIELKVEDDTDLVWQCIYYSQQIKKIYNKEVRMIVIAPNYTKNILDTLIKVKKEMNINIELYKFTYELQNNKLTKFIPTQIV